MGAEIDQAACRSFDPEPFLNPRIEQLSITTKTDYRHVINLSSNEANLAGLRALFLQYLKQVPDTASVCYPAWPTLIHETANFYGISSAALVMDSGSDSAIRMILGLLGRTCGRIILQEPNYINYRHFAELANCEVTSLRHPAELWSEEVAEFARPILATGCPSLVVITNPNGFTGTLIPQTEMERLCDLCAANNHMLLIDEAYAPFASIPHQNLLERYPGVVIVRSFSKNCGMAGLRLGMIIADDPVAAYLRRGCGINSVSSLAAGFLSFCFTHVDTIKAEHQRLEGIRAHMAESVLRIFPAWRSPTSATNFLLFNTGSPATAEALARHLASRHIIIKSFVKGNPGLRACLRMTICDTDIMAEVLSELRAFKSEQEC